MCGICGIVAINGVLPPDIAAALPAMARAIRHRGPDAEGFFSDGVVGLGHRRLSIIDVARGGQPVANEDGTKWIVFNGEIYNHRYLRADLSARGHAFHTDSDTEAILHGYEQYGEDIVNRLEGMFAFAIYDSVTRELFIARDRLGKKPLFYAIFNDVLHFGSEIKCFYASPAWDGSLNLDALEGYFSLGYYIAPDTIYRGVRKLEPGHWLRLRSGKLETRQYWDIVDFDVDRRPEGEVLEELEALLRQAVKERLESEVPLGAFLSGGIDSGLVVSFMAEGASDVVTVSVGFANDRRSELDAAAITAHHFGTRHHPHVLEAHLEEILDPIVTAFDEPFADSSAIPTWYVSKAAREHVTVALSGDGGDETFAGYDFRYVPHAIEAWARVVVPRSTGSAFVRWLGAVWPRSPRLPKSLRVGTLFDNLGVSPADAYYADLCFLKPSATRQLLGLTPQHDARLSPVYEAVTAPYRRCPSPSAVQRIQYADLKVYMPNDPLVKVDRMAMQHGLEVRCPLLDRRLVEFAFRLPTEAKMPRLKGKHLLRRLALKRLPSGLSKLPKAGFTAPVGAWLAGQYADMFASDALGTSSPLRDIADIGHLRRIYEEHRRGEADHAYALWATWVFDRWARRHRASH
jgi:asparagine synthase (glutamine-hydrolysing)